MNRTMQQYTKLPYSVEESSNRVFAGKIMDDGDTNNIKVFHDAVKKHYIEQYCSNKHSLLDVGAGKLRDLEFWSRANVKNVVTIEPSLQSFLFGEQRLRATEHAINVERIQGGAHEDWFNNDNFSSITKHAPFSCISFMFSIHFLMGGREELFRKIAHVSSKGTYIIILCMNGELVKQQLDLNDNIIRLPNDKEPVFEIKPFGENEIEVYLKGIYGLNKGCREYLVNVNQLIQKFKTINCNLVENRPFRDIDLPERKLLTPLQAKISNFNYALVFLRD